MKKIIIHSKIRRQISFLPKNEKKEKKRKKRRRIIYFSKSSIPKTDALNKLKKMMTFTLNIILVLMTLAILRGSNPIKIAIRILIIRSLVFIKLIILRGNIWIYSIIFLLFMGGILVLFIIISSLIPNSKRKKYSWRRTRLIIVLRRPLILTQETRETLFINLKWTLINKNILMFFRLIISCYFFCFLELVKKLKTPIRSYTCWREEIL